MGAGLKTEITASAKKSNKTIRIPINNSLLLDSLIAKLSSLLYMLNPTKSNNT
jgi:hypothetical protein